MTANRIAHPKQTLGLWLGLFFFSVILFFGDLDPDTPAVTYTAAVGALMAVWWITEAIPISATALLPVVLFPVLGVMPGKETASHYFNDVVFLFVGGFIVALAMQRWHLHRRIALWIVMLIGTSTRRILLSFMVATAFLSMWISNTATTMIMVPIALSLIVKFRETADSAQVKQFSIALLLGIAYSASIGGVATLIGTPPNLALVRIFAINFPNAPELSFATWIAFGLPFSVIFLAVAWLLLMFLFMRQRFSVADTSLLREEYRSLGPVSFEERAVLILSGVMALLWLFRRDIQFGFGTLPGWSSILPEPGFIDDGTIAITVVVLLFVLPSKSRPGRLMNWETATKLHWGIVLLFGGGFALAAGFKESGLSAWVASQMTGMSGVPPLLQVAGTCTVTTFLTEITSNTATTQIILPLLGSLAVAIQANPLLLMIPATISASCAFMLPVATPPNAIVFGSGEVSMADMVKAGLVLNIVGIVLTTGLMYLLGLFVFGIDPGQLPSWAH